MIEKRKQEVRAWFHTLRDHVCYQFEKIEAEWPQTAPNGHTEKGRFSYKKWHRQRANHENDVLKTSHHPASLEDTPKDGGQIAVIRGRVFEKAGVNISTVQGVLSPEFRKEIPGASETGAFWASGISVIAHMHSPFIPAIHMNTRCIVTEKSWFGGGIDLNPVFPDTEDKKMFHDYLKEICAQHDPSYYQKFSQWCEQYFYIKHRQCPRGVGGIFYDRLENQEREEENFAFTRAVGESLLHIFPKIIARHQDTKWTEEDRQAQLRWRGLYSEFNLVYDRGTRFGLMTGGYPGAVLVSLPPLAAW